MREDPFRYYPSKTLRAIELQRSEEAECFLATVMLPSEEHNSFQDYILWQGTELQELVPVLKDFFSDPAGFMEKHHNYEAPQFEPEAGVADHTVNFDDLEI